MLERWLAHPAHWADAVLNIATVGHGIWMDASCIDAYLMKYWLDNEVGAQVIYVPMKFQPSLQQEKGLDFDEVQSLHEFIGYQDGGHWVQHLYATVIHHHNHFFVTVFNYHGQCVNVYGSSITAQNHYYGWRDDIPADKGGDENSWMGKRMYMNLKVALSNHQPDTTPTCETVNWVQVGLFCFVFVPYHD